MGTKQTVDLAIVGAGVTGLSSAMHAQKAGIKRIALIDPGLPDLTRSLIPAAMICSAPLENITRMTHTWGGGFADRYQRFADAAYQVTRAFFRSESIPFSEQPLSRLLLTEHEKAEAEVAVNLHKTLGRASEVSTDLPRFAVHAGVAVQGGEDKYALIDPYLFLDRMQSHYFGQRYRLSAQALQRESSGDYSLSLSDGTELQSHYVILANHLAIPQLLGVLKDAFVSTCEQAVVFATPSSKAQSPQGFLVNYAHETHLALANGRFYASGARFLRKHAGVDLPEATDDHNVVNFLKKRAQEIWGSSEPFTKEQTWYGFECRPCDELPIIGPMFGETGILLASGYMNQGLSFGFFSGSILADLIAFGKSERLPRGLMPERLRSLRSAE